MHPNLCNISVIGMYLGPTSSIFILVGIIAGIITAERPSVSFEIGIYSQIRKLQLLVASKIFLSRDEGSQKKGPHHPSLLSDGNGILFLGKTQTAAVCDSRERSKELCAEVGVGGDSNWNLKEEGFSRSQIGTVLTSFVKIIYFLDE